MHWNRLKKAVSIVTLITFICSNSAYGVPSSRSLFKNKRVDHKKLSTQREKALQRKKSIFQTGDEETEKHKRQAQRLLSDHLKDLTQIHIPSEFGRVIEVYDASDEPRPVRKSSISYGARVTSHERRLIVHIQDLHTNPEAELNLANILDILLKDYNLGLVCSEGADGEVDTSSVSSFPDYEVREKTARIFINSGELTGEEYLSITKYPDLPIWGIEDRDIYFKNIIEFNRIMKFSPSSQVFISQTKKALEQLKPKVYSKELLLLDQKETDYRNEKIETDEYLKYLTSYLNKFNIPTANYRNIALLSEAIAQEQSIDQLKIMQESQNLLINLRADIAKKNLQTEMDSLMVKAQLFKEQKISPFSFYSYLKDLTLRHIPDKISKYPNLFDFIGYLTKINSLDSTKLFVEMEALTYDVKQRLAKTEEQKLLTKALRNINFLEGFFNLKVSNEELDYYLENRESHKVGFFKDFLTPTLKRYNISSFIDYNPDLIDAHLQELKDFYETVKARDVAMVRNALSEIEKRNTRVSALVSGGFHTKGITRMLRERGYSYIVVSPYSSTDIDEENYHFLLSGKRWPISELISSLENTLRITLGFMSAAGIRDYNETVVPSLVNIWGGREDDYRIYGLDKRSARTLVGVVLKLHLKNTPERIQNIFGGWPLENLFTAEEGEDLIVRLNIEGTEGRGLIVRREKDGEVSHTLIDADGNIRSVGEELFREARFIIATAEIQSTPTHLANAVDRGKGSPLQLLIYLLAHGYFEGTSISFADLKAARNISDTTLRHEINSLMAVGLLERTSRGMYSLSEELTAEQIDAINSAAERVVDKGLDRWTLMDLGEDKREEIRQAVEKIKGGPIDVFSIFASRPGFLNGVEIEGRAKEDIERDIIRNILGLQILGEEVADYIKITGLLPAYWDYKAGLYRHSEMKDTPFWEGYRNYLLGIADRELMLFAQQKAREDGNVGEEEIKQYAEEFHRENLNRVVKSVGAVLDWEPEVLGHSLREDLINLYALHVVRTVMKAVLLNDPMASTFNPYADTNAKANETAVEIVEEELLNSLPDLEHEIRRWVKLAIGGGVIDLNNPVIREDYRADPDGFIERHFRKASNTDFAHEYFERDFERFYKDVASSRSRVRLVYFLDNNGEAVFDLALIQKLMEANPNLTVYVVPKAQTLGNDISYDELVDIISNNQVFRILHNFYRTKKQKRLHIVKEGPRIQGVDGERLSKELADTLEGTTDEKVIGMFAGQANFETTQGWNIPRYYKFMAKGKGMAMATGLPQKEQAFVFCYIPAGVTVGTGDSYFIRKSNMEGEGEELYFARQTLLDFEQAIHSGEYAGRVDRYLNEKEANEGIMEEAFETGRTFSEVVFSYDIEVYESLIKLGLIEREADAGLRAGLIEDAIWGTRERKSRFRKEVESFAGIRDLVTSQRIPDKEEAEERAREFLRAIAIRAARTGKSWSQVDQNEFGKHFGSTQFVTVAGRGSRFSKLVHKGLFIGSQGEPNIRLAINGSYRTPGTRPVIFISMHQLRWIVKDEFIPQLNRDMQGIAEDSLPQGWNEGVLPEDVIDPDKRKKYFTEDALVVLCKPYGPGYYLGLGTGVLKEQELFDQTAYKQIVFGEMATAQDLDRSNASLITYMEAIIGNHLITAGGKKVEHAKEGGFEIAKKGNFFIEDGRLVALTDWSRIPEDKREELTNLGKRLKNWLVFPGRERRRLQDRFAIDSEGNILINSNTVIFANEIQEYFGEYNDRDHHPEYWEIDKKTGLPLALAWDFIKLVADKLRGKPFKGEWPIGFIDVGNAPSSLKDMARQTHFSNQYNTQLIDRLKEINGINLGDGANLVIYLGDKADFNLDDLSNIFAGKADISGDLYLDSRAFIGKDVSLTGRVRLSGKVKVGDEVNISNSVVEGPVEIKSGCVLENTVVCEGAGYITESVTGLMKPEQDLAKSLSGRSLSKAKEEFDKAISQGRYTSVATALISILDGNDMAQRAQDLLKDLIRQRKLNDYGKLLRKMIIVAPTFKRQSELFALIMDMGSEEIISAFNRDIIIDAIDEQLFSFSLLAPSGRLPELYGEGEISDDAWVKSLDKRYEFFGQVFNAPNISDEKKREIMVELIDRYPISSGDIRALYFSTFGRSLIEDVVENWQDESVEKMIEVLIGTEALNHLEDKEREEAEAKEELRRNLEIVLNNEAYQELLAVFSNTRGVMNRFIDMFIRNTNQTFEEIVLAQRNPLYKKTDGVKNNVYKRPRILGIMGGSGGTPTLLMENLLSELFGGDVTMAIVGSPHDDGGSSRRAQDQLKRAQWGYIPSPGDPMNVLSSLTIKEGDIAKAKRKVIRSRFGKDVPPNTSFRNELLKILKEETDVLIRRGFEDVPLDWLYFVRHTLGLAEELDKKLVEPGHLALAGGSVGNFIFIAHHVKENVITDRGRVSEGAFNESMEKLAQNLGLSNNFLLPSTLDPATLYAKLEALELLIDGESIKCKVEDESGRHESTQLTLPRMTAELQTGESLTVEVGRNILDIAASEDSLLAFRINGIRARIVEDFSDIISREDSKTTVDLKWRLADQKEFKVQQGDFTARYKIKNGNLYLELVEKTETGDIVRFEDYVEEGREIVIGKPEDLLTARVRMVKDNEGDHDVSVRLDAKGQGTTIYFGNTPVTCRGRLIIEQTNITESVHTSGIIDTGFIEGARPTPNKKVLDLINNTQEAIVLGPGSLITSILPVLMVPEIAEAIAKRKAQGLSVIFIVNPYKDNETVDITIRRIVKLFERKTGRRIEDLFSHMIINDPERATEEIKELMHGLSDTDLTKIMSETRDASDFSSAAKKSRGALMITKDEMRELLGRVKVLAEPLVAIVPLEVRKARKPGEPEAKERGIGYDAKQLGQAVENIILEKGLERVAQLPVYQELLEAYYGYIDDEGQQQYDTDSLDYDIRRLLRDEGSIFRPDAIMRTPLEILFEIRQKREEVKSSYMMNRDIAQHPPKIIIANIAHTLLQYRTTSARRKKSGFKVSPKMVQGIDQYLRSRGILIIQTALKLSEIQKNLIDHLDEALRHRIILAPYAGTQVWTFDAEGNMNAGPIIDYSSEITREQQRRWLDICREAAQVYELDRYLYGPDGLVDRPVEINNRDGLLINFEMDNRRDLPEQLAAELNERLKKNDRPGWEIPRIEKKGVLNDQRDAIIIYLTRRFEEEGLPIVAEKPHGSSAINTRLKSVERGGVIRAILNILNRQQIERGNRIYKEEDIFVIGGSNEAVLAEFPGAQGLYFREEFISRIPDNVLVYDGTYGIHGTEEFFAALALMKRRSPSSALLRERVGKTRTCTDI